MMEAGKLIGMVKVFEGLEDWRNAQPTRRRLSELLTIAVSSALKTNNWPIEGNVA